jgi:TolB-like protein
MSNLFVELQRRNVIRVAGVYAVVGWVLAQIATTLEETLGLPAWFDSLIVALLLLGFPIALVMAWAFELTPEGVIRTEDVPPGESITAETGRKLDVTIVVALFALVALVAWQNFDGGSQSNQPVEAGMPMTDAQASDASIAVLPFADLSPAGDQEYFSDGIAEEILNVLVGVKGLEVTSRTSSFQFKGQELGIPQIAAELNVRHVLEGSVRKSGNTIRVTAQLIDSGNDKHLWSETYDRPLTTENLFEIQDEIATSIVEALSSALGVASLEPIRVRAKTRNLDAYELYLQARPLFHSRTDLDVADELLSGAIEQDPEFVHAWEIRSALQTLMLEYGYSDTPQAEAEERAIEMANRALELEPRSPTALAVLAKVEGEKVSDLRGGVRIVDIFAKLDLALEIEPHNASALNWRGLRYLMVGYLEEALADFATCMNFEPYYRPCVENYYTVLGAMGRDAESLAEFEKAISIGAANFEFAYLPSMARLDQKIPFMMATNGDRMLRDWTQHGELWDAYQDPSGDHSGLIDSMRQYFRNNQSTYFVFTYVAHPIGMGWQKPDVLVKWDAMMRNYRQSPEFKEYMRASGALDYWLEYGFPPQCRRLANDDFECD